MMLSHALLGLLLLVAMACGGTKESAKKAPEAPASAATTAEPAAAPSADLAPKGDDLNRLCDFYASAVIDQAEMMGEEAKSDPLASCKKAMAPRSAAERQQIADCANACGDTEGVVDCFDDFGKDSFPACGGDE